MSEANSTINPALAGEKKWDLNSLLQKVLELQELLVQVQEKNLLLAAQTRELERITQDADDLKAELATQALIVADKTRENKVLHQELSKVTGLLDSRMRETEHLKSLVTDLQHQLKTRESERDLLAVMLKQAEDAKRRYETVESDQSKSTGQHKKLEQPGWLRNFKKK